MKFDLDALSLDELKSLQKQIVRAIEGFEERRKRSAIAELEAKARDLGFSLEQLMGMSGKVTKARSKAVPKYANPESPHMTWTGRGRKPAWFEQALAAGKSADDLLI